MRTLRARWRELDLGIKAGGDPGIAGQEECVPDKRHRLPARLLRPRLSVRSERQGRRA